MTVERCDDGPLTVVEKEEGPAIADYDDRGGRLALTIGQTHFRTTVVVHCNGDGDDGDGDDGDGCDGDEGHDGVDDGDEYDDDDGDGCDNVEERDGVDDGDDDDNTHKDGYDEGFGRKNVNCKL